MEQELTVKQRKFADEYIKTGNATDAAIKAGYSKKTANVIGSENLAKPYLKAYIDAKLDEMSNNKIAEAEEVLEILTSIARNEIKEEIPLFVGEGVQVLKEKKLLAKDRLKALELLGKRYALFTDRVDVEGSTGVVIVDDID